MESLQSSPKICLTVSGALIDQDHVLLIKHKKLGIWLNPGGHIEENEAPHAAAEREFFEETGVRVEAVDWQELKDETSKYLPHPLLTNLHWASEKNYLARIDESAESHPEKQWQRGCEQHLNFVYLMKPIDSVAFTQNHTETTGIQWFNLHQLEELDLVPNIKIELGIAWEKYKTYVK